MVSSKNYLNINTSLKSTDHQKLGLRVPASQCYSAMVGFITCSKGNSVWLCQIALCR